MSLKKSLLGLVWQSDEVEASSPTPIQETQVPQPTHPIRTETIALQVPVYVQAHVTQEDETQVDQFLKNFDTHIPSFPLVKAYYEANNKLAGKNLPDGALLDIILTTLQLVHPQFAKEQLVAEFSSYYESIQKEKIDFDKELRSFEQSNLGAPKRQIQLMLADIKTHEDKILELKAEIEKTQTNIDASMSKISTSEASFNKALSLKSQSIQNTISILK